MISKFTFFTYLFIKNIDLIKNILKNKINCEQNKYNNIIYYILHETQIGYDKQKSKLY